MKDINKLLEKEEDRLNLWVKTSNLFNLETKKKTHRIQLPVLLNSTELNSDAGFRAERVLTTFCGPRT